MQNDEEPADVRRVAQVASAVAGGNDMSEQGGTQPEAPPAPTLLILCTDLFFSTKITATAKAVGRPFAVARSLEKLSALLSFAAPHPLLVIDLNIGGVDPIAAITLAKEHPGAPRILTFLSHVQADLAAAAKQAGAHQILARSAFSAQLEQLLAQ